MKRHMGIMVLALLVLVVLAIYTVAFMVDETKDIVLITRFGNVARVIDGSKDPGLHFKWPYPVEKLIRYDSRERLLVSSYKQCSLVDKNNIMASVFCTWKIKDPVKFNAANKTAAEADSALQGTLTSEMSAAIGYINMNDLVNTDPAKMKIEKICDGIRTNVQEKVGENYGIEITDLGLNRVGLPKVVSQAVIQAMSEERSKEIKKYQSEGQAVAEAITSRATAAKKKILAFANRKAGDIRTQGETKAAEAYAKFQQDPEFSMFLRSVESLRASLKDRTVFLLDANTLPILQWLRTQPDMNTFKTQKRSK